METQDSVLAELRMVSQQFIGNKILSAVELISWFGAIQAQEYSLSKWSIGSRIMDLMDSGIEKDLDAGAILRLHILRPTWHFVAADDVKWMLKLSAHRVKAQNSPYMRKLQLDHTLIKNCIKILLKSLQDGRFLTRTEINGKFKDNKISIHGNALAYVMMEAELDGIICSGPRKGNQFTYALLEERATKTTDYSKDEALSVFTDRYFKSRGPATVYDFSAWSGLTIADCKRGIEINNNTLRKYVNNRREYFMSDSSPKMAFPVPGTFFLPPYDEFIMGYKDRSVSFIFKNDGYSDLPVPYSSLLLKNGQIVGSWRRVSKKNCIEIEYHVFRKGYPEKDEIDRTIRRFSQFYSLPVLVKER